MPDRAAARSGLPRLHVVTEDAVGDRAVAVVGEVVAAGAPVVQVRVKGAGDGDAYRHVREVVACTRAAGATCLVDDRVAVALAAGADGVHLGASDLPVSAARAVVDRAGAGLLVGGTARDPDTARRLVAEGADYLGVGPCYTTSSKTGLPSPGGTDRVAAVADAVDVPIIAIGGVTAARVPELVSAGAHGVAVIGAVWRSGDPVGAVHELLAALDHAEVGP